MLSGDVMTTESPWTASRFTPPRPTSGLPCPPLPTARAGVAVTALGKRIMVIGGVGTNQLPLKVVEMYSIDEGKWKKRSTLREAAMGISVTAKGKRGQGCGWGDKKE